jgi:hypothetical protein
MVFIVFRRMSFALMRKKRRKKRRRKRKSRLMILNCGFRLSTNLRSCCSCCHPNRMNRCFWFLRSMMIRCCCVKALSTALKMMILRVCCKPAYCFRCCVTE